MLHPICTHNNDASTRTRLEQRDARPAKATKKQPERYVYITVTTTKTTPYGYHTEDNATNDDAYESQEDAENTSRQMANDDYPRIKWEVSTEHHILRIYTNEGRATGYDYDDNSIELKVERVRLKPEGCMKKVALKRTRDEDDSEDEGREDEG